VIALSYDPKIDRVMESFGQIEYCLDIDEATAELVEAKIRALLAEIDVARARIEEAASACRLNLEAQYDGLFGAVRQVEEALL
jgi:polysaccharide pyruvyl transferase WcaK-like protein